MQKKLSIIIPSRPNIENLSVILTDLQKQTFQDFQVIIVIDKKISHQEFQELKYSINKKIHQENNIKERLNIKYFSTINSDFISKKNASATRNYGIKQANTEYIYLFDDDNSIAPDHLEKTFKYYKELKKELKSELVLTGSLYYRKTQEIQNEGFKDYNYRIARPTLNLLKKKKRDTIRMYSGNGLFGPTHIFQENFYDENFDFVAEDLDCTYRISKKYPIIVHKDLEVQHMERKKSYLEHAWIGNEFGAYRKAKHRILFAKKHANGYQKIAFWGFGVWGNSIWLLIKIVLFGKKKRRKIIKSFYKGMRDGINTSIK